MLIQDCPTRWDSTYSLLERLLEQKKAVIVYDSDFGLPDTLSGNEWQIVAKLVNLLEPFQRTTKEFSRYTCSVSQVSLV